MYKEYKSEIINPCKYPLLDFGKYKMSMLIHSLGLSGLNVRSLPICLCICLFSLFLAIAHTIHFLNIFVTAVLLTDGSTMNKIPYAFVSVKNG